MIWLGLLFQQPATIAIDPAVELGTITRSMTGSCIEDVNHEIYGGLYAQAVFGESFEEPVAGSKPKDWQLFGEAWVPDGGGVHVSSGPGFKLVYREAVSGDQEIEADVAIANDFGINAGFVMRASNLGVGADQFDGYEISMSAREQRVILGKHEHNFRQLAEAPAPIANGRWHHLRVRCQDARIQVFVDHEATPRIDYLDSTRPLTGSQVGLRTWHADASFRNVSVGGRQAGFDWSSPGTSPRWDPLLSPGSRGTLRIAKDGFTGSYCQVLESSGRGRTGVANRGLNKWGIAVVKGYAMAGGLAVKGDSLPVTVALQSADGSRTYAKTTIVAGSSGWQYKEFSLVPNATDANCRLALWIDKPGEVALDQVQLFQPKENRYMGLPVRADIVAKMKEAGISFLRYGGTMVNTQNYRWKNMIGRRELRPAYVGQWNSSSTNGFGIFDFLDLCERASIGCAFAINAEETPEDAADLADYLTAPTSNPWGAKRAADGHPKPYNVDYIEIGNEECLASQTRASFQHYCDQFEKIAKAIHGRNPNLKLVCAAWWVDESTEMEAVFHRIDGLAAAWDIHVGGDDPNSGAQVDRQIGGIRDKFLRWNPKTGLKVVVFEENGGTHAMQRALGHATNVNAARRWGDFVLVDCAANCLQPIQQNDNGWDQGQVFFDPSRAWLMPPAIANRLLNDTYQPIRIQAKADPSLDVLAAKSRDGKHAVVTVVNTNKMPISTLVSFRGSGAKIDSVRTISGNLADVQTPIKAGRADGWAVSLPVFSITTIEVSLKP